MWYVVFHFFRLLVQRGDWTCKCKDLFRVLENFQPTPSLSHSLRAKYWLKTGNYSNSGFRFKQWHGVVRFLIGASVSKVRCKIFKYCFKTTDSIKRGGGGACSSCSVKKSPMVPNLDPKQYWNNWKNDMSLFSATNQDRPYEQLLHNWSKA